MDLGTTALLIVAIIAVTTLVFQRQANKYTKTIEDLSDEVAYLNQRVTTSATNSNENFSGVKAALRNHKEGIEAAHDELGSARSAFNLLLKLNTLMAKQIVHLTRESAARSGAPSHPLASLLGLGAGVGRPELPPFLADILAGRDNDDDEEAEDDEVDLDIQVHELTPDEAQEMLDDPAAFIDKLRAGKIGDTDTPSLAECPEPPTCSEADGAPEAEVLEGGPGADDLEANLDDDDEFDDDLDDEFDDDFDDDFDDEFEEEEEELKDEKEDPVLITGEGEDKPTTMSGT